MAIIDGTQTATLADIEARIEIVNRQLAELEEQRAQHLDRLRDVDAEALTPKIRNLYERLFMYRDYIQLRHLEDVDAPRPVGAVSKWLQLRETLTAEYDVALAAVIERLSAEALARAEAAWRVLASFRNDALEATGDKRFHPQGTPPAPASHPLTRKAGVDLAKLSMRRNPFERRPTIDKSRWAHLMAKT